MRKYIEDWSFQKTIIFLQEYLSITYDILHNIHIIFSRKFIKYFFLIPIDHFDLMMGKMMKPFYAIVKMKDPKKNCI